MLSKMGRNELTLGLLIVAVACLKMLSIWVILPIAADHGMVPPTVFSSNDLYLDVARNLAAGNGYRVTPDSSETMMRGPGYVLFLAGLIKLFGESFSVFQIANLLLGLGTTCIVFLLTKKLTASNTISIISALVFALHPSTLVMETRINVECYFTFLLAVFVFLLYRAMEAGTLRKYFAAGLALGFVVLTRSSPIFVVPLIFFYLIVSDRTSSPFGQAAMKTGALVIATLIVLSPWMVRNYSLSGVPTFSENLIGITAFLGQYATKTMGEAKPYNRRILDARRKQSEIVASKGANFTQHRGSPFWDIFPTIENEQFYNKILLQYAIKEYKKDPALFLKHIFYNSFRFWFQGATPKITLLGLTVMIPLLILTVIGSYIGIQHGLKVAPLLLPILAIYSVHIPLIAHARYSMPLLPLLAVLAGIAFNAAMQRKWRKSKVKRP